MRLMKSDIGNWFKAGIACFGALLSLFLNVEAQEIISIKGGARVSFTNGSVVSINGSLTSEAGSSLTANGEIEVYGDWTIGGSQSATAGNIKFLGTNSSTINCPGLNAQFFLITTAKTGLNTEVKIITPIITSGPFLSLISGTFNLDGAFGFASPALLPVSGELAIPAGARFILNDQLATVIAQDANLRLGGELILLKGEFQIGDGSSESGLLYSNGARLEIGPDASAKLIVSAAIMRENDNDSISYVQSGGLVRLGTTHALTQPGRGLFDVGTDSSSFTITGGTIELKKASSTATEEFLVRAAKGTVTGGKVVIDADEAGSDFEINSSMSIGELDLSAANNPKLKLGSDLTVLGDITLAGNGSDRFDFSNYELRLGGDWTNNLSSADGISFNGRALRLVGDSLQKLQGSAALDFPKLYVEKTGGSSVMEGPMTVSDTLRLVSNAALDMNGFDLTIGEDAAICSDYGNQEGISTFSANNFIFNSGSGSDPLVGSRLIRKINPARALPFDLYFPIGSPNSYTPATVTFNAGGATFLPSAEIAIKPVPLAHPAIETPDRSMLKYWVIKKQNISINNNGATLLFNYNPAEVEGNEGNYEVLYYSPSWDDPTGYWRINPGESDDVVDFNAKLFYSQQVDEIDGDWLAGEPDAARGTYFARQDGPWDDPDTWSKDGFDMPASSRAPSKLSDVVRIQNHKITISSQPTAVNKISVETGTDGRASGELVIIGGVSAIGDTFMLEPDAKLTIAHSEGISAVPALTGAVQTDFRSFSSQAIYEYSGNSEQVTGDGLPDITRALIISKSSGSRITLSKNVSITDSLVINDGALDMSLFTLNGHSADRTLTMRGGELIVPGSFPLNYASPSFAAGIINFQGAGNATIPSSGSTPGVNQYYDLKISSPPGQTRSGNVSLRSQGEIRISNNLDVGSLEFTDNSYRFLTDGSTVRFNKAGGSQNVQTRPSLPADSLCYLNYYTLIVDGGGTKSLTAGTGSPIFKILNELRIEGGSTLAANGFDLEVQGNWINQSGAFQPGASSVILRSPVATYSTVLNARDTTDNPFNNLLIAGAGEVYVQDNTLIRGNLSIDSASILKVTDRILTVGGNWTNRGGTFNYGSSEVIFNGSAQQSISNPVASVNFYNLTLKNPAGLLSQSIGTTQDNGINVFGALNLEQGKIDSRGKLVTAYGSLTRAGGGYVDGALAKPVPTGATTLIYEVGYGSRYTPANITFTGTGGGAGNLAVLSDTIKNGSAPVSWSSTEDYLQPLGSTMSFPRHARRQWTIFPPAGSSFAMGTRRYDATLEFIGSDAPSGDLYNSADPERFEARLLTPLNVWIKPYQWLDRPFISSRAQNSLTFSQLDTLGTIIVGEPGIQTYYARRNGAWTNRLSWSTIGYGGGPATDYPGQHNDMFTAYIGAGYTIDLDANDINVEDTGLIQIDSSGRLNCDSNVINGAGEFRMMKYSTLGIGNAAGISDSGSATGNIQTLRRYYNYGGHNRSKFVYTGAVPQTQANSGVPATVAMVSVEKTSGSQLTWDKQNVTINDSLRIMSGAFHLGANTNCNISLNGNMRRGAGAAFNANKRRFTISGAVEDTLYNEDASPINFHDLTIAKPVASGFVVLWDNTPIIVDSLLTFTAPVTNKLLIDARTRTGNYVQIGQNGSVVNAGIGKGWVDGEMRRWVPAGATGVIRWEIGDTARYNPYEVQFTNAGSGSVAGYVGAKMIVGEHPFHQPQIFHSIAVGRTVGPKFWRVTRPSGSNFARGGRTYNTGIYFYWPEDGKNIDGWGCAELSYLKRWGVDTAWVRVWPSNNVNSALAGYLCTDTRNLSRTPNYNYTGDLVGGLASVVANAMNTDFGTDQMIGSDLLLGDFIVGNQDSLKKFYNYYSIKDGDWNDPSTWSTESYSSAVNLAASDPDPLITGVPRRQYDNAFIGNGKRVVLNTNIGTNQFSSAEPLNTMLGPSVVVQNTGTLSLNYHTLRGNTFSLEKGGKLEVGSQSGISFLNGFGNIIPQDRRPAFIDSTSFVYTAEGRTIDALTLIPGGQINRNSNTFYIENVIIRDQGGNAIMTNTTLDSLRRNSFGINPYLDKKVVLTAGETYTVQIDPSANGNQRRYKAYIDYDYNGTYDNTLPETVLNNVFSDNTLFTLGSFTVPAGTAQGSTQIRICMNSNNNDFTPTSNGNGEFEEYTVDIINPNTTITQSTGSGLPPNLASLEVRTQKAAATVTLGKNITVRDSLKISTGTLNAGANTIALTGDFINNVNNGFNAGTSAFRFINNDVSRIRGSQPVRFYRLDMDKLDNISRVDVSVPVSIQNQFNFNNANVLSITNASTLTFENTCATNGWTNFGPKKMFRLTGDTLTNGKLTRVFTNAAGSKAFTFPIGIDTLYNPAIIAITGTYAGSPTISASVVSGRHPQKLTGAVSMLNKYWKISTTGISNITADSVNLTYHWRDTAGNANKYLPGVYLINPLKNRTGWEVNLGQNPLATPYSISARNVQDEVTIDGDWTAAEPKTYFGGRRFYSIATGNWKSPTSWSNAGHASPVIASYYPGQIFPDDSVFIDGHVITFNADSMSVDTLNIGGTNGIAAVGELRMPNSPATKSLTTRQLTILEDGRITQNSTGARRDTINIKQNFTNSSNAFLDFRANDSNYTALKFYGAGPSIITGEGNWGEFGDIIIKKYGGLLDTLIVSSQKFCDATTLYSPQLRFTLGGGIIKHLNADTLNLSGPGLDVPMASGSGIYVATGVVNTFGSLFSNSNTTIRVAGGVLNIGDAPNENLKYATGSTVQVDGGALNVAGCITRSLLTSNLRFIMNGGETRVLTKGNTNPGDIGFDMTTAASELTLAGGRLIIANGGGSTPSDADLRLNAAGGAGIGGSSVIQIGDSALTPNNAVIKISGNLPLRNLHLANNPLYLVTTRLTEEVYRISSNFDIDVNHTFQLNGNTLRLGGSLTNYGSFIGTPASATTLPWLVELNGPGDQSLFNSRVEGLELFNLKINKASGNVTLSGANSLLKVSNQLEFAYANNAILVAPNSTSVTVAPKSGVGVADILRSGAGHVFGRLYRHAPAGANISFFPVGSDTLSSYRPVWIQTYAGDNAAGLLGVKHYSNAHPDTAASGVVTSTNIRQWWNLESPASGGFSLGTTKYAVRTQFLNPRDLRGAAPMVMDHFRRTPAWNASPASWLACETSEKTDTTLRSVNHNAFGDIIIGEPRGTTFFAWLDNGDWTNPASWSLDGYDVRTTPVNRWPNQNTDVVRIGNAKRIVVPDGAPQISIKQTIVERYAGKPGALAIRGNLGYVRGKNFILEDSCTVEIENVQGIKPYTETNNGAIQTEFEPTWGLGRFVFNSPFGNQSTGLGVPQNMKTLVVDNRNNLQDTVFLTSYIGIPNLNVRDTLLIRRGKFLVSDRNLTLNRAMVLDSSVRNGSLVALNNHMVQFTGASNYQLYLNNNTGAAFRNLRLNGELSVRRGPQANRTLANVTVRNTLDFAGPGDLALEDSVNLRIENSAANAITNYSTDRFIRTSASSGSLIRAIAPGINYTFPVGTNDAGVSHYSPAQFTPAPGGTAGRLGVRAAVGSKGGFPGAHSGIQTLPTSAYLKRFWSVDSVTAQINGKFRFNYYDSDVAGSEAEFDKLARWRPARQALPGSWKAIPAPFIDILQNYFETEASYAYAEFEGDYTIGNQSAFRRIFYSRSSGLWNDANTWTYSDTHSGPILGLGIWPDNPTDSVVIGGGTLGAGNHVVDLNIPTTVVSGITLGTPAFTGTLSTGLNVVAGSYFTMSPGSTLRIGSPEGISSLGNSTGNVRSTVTRSYSAQGIYEYDGATAQALGDGLPASVKGLIVAKAAGTELAIDRSISVTDFARVDAGTLDLSAYSLSGVGFSVGRAFSIADGARLRLGGANNLLSAIPGYDNYSGITTNSYVEFYGDAQTINAVPGGIALVGLGNVDITGAGTKRCSGELLIRGDLRNLNGATFEIEDFKPLSLEVRKSVINEATFKNCGIIEIGL